MKRLLIGLLSLQIALILSLQTVAQVSIAPTVLIIKDQTGVASITINNTSETAKEVKLSFDFGYPDSDSLGNLIMVYGDTVNRELYGLDSYMRIFPRSFNLAPNGQQVVRIQVKPLAGRTDGTYYSRMIISSSEAAKDIETVNMDGGVGTQINYVFNQNIPVLYTKGKCTTELSVQSVNTSLDNNLLASKIDLKLEGNSPFLGTLYTRLLDKSGNEVAKTQQTLVAYFDVLRRSELTLPEALAAGDYTLEFTFETQRNDIPQTDLVQADKLVFKHPVKL
jgi:P pilus assembly chaperone PapD